MKYKLESLVKDASLKKALEKALSDDGKLSYSEVKDIISSTLDGKGVTFQEFKDLQTILKTAKTLDVRSKMLIQEFLRTNHAIRHTNTANCYSFSIKGKNLLKSIENIRLLPYDDQTGKDIATWVKGATIGYGHLFPNADWQKYKAGITEIQASSLYDTDLMPFVNTIKAKVKANITQNEFDAMVILAFNIGQTAFTNSSVLKLVNNPKAITSYTDLEAAWKAWNKSQGSIMKGLNNRRKSEWDIYKKGVYQKW